jgi:hypothetical protein
MSVRDEKSLSKNLLELLVPEWTKDAACQVVVDRGAGKGCCYLPLQSVH